MGVPRGAKRIGSEFVSQTEPSFGEPGMSCQEIGTRSVSREEPGEISEQRDTWSHALE